MDSITQAALGTAVAYGCWRRQLGRRALAWGFALGTLPDLDILAFPWLDDVGRLVWHRGESHPLWAMLLGALLLAPLLVRIHKNPTPPREPLGFRAAFAGIWLIFASHVLIDVFTVYGTQLLAPLSRHGFGLNNLFIIDPLYTAPLVLGILLAAMLRAPRAPSGQRHRTRPLHPLRRMELRRPDTRLLRLLRRTRPPGPHHRARPHHHLRHAAQHRALASPRRSRGRLPHRLLVMARCG